MGFASTSSTLARRGSLRILCIRKRCSGQFKLLDSDCDGYVDRDEFLSYYDSYLNEVDRDPVSQCLILEQFIEEVRSACRLTSGRPSVRNVLQHAAFSSVLNGGTASISSFKLAAESPRSCDTSPSASCEASPRPQAGEPHARERGVETAS